MKTAKKRTALYTVMLAAFLVVLLGSCAAKTERTADVAQADREPETQEAPLTAVAEVEGAADFRLVFALTPEDYEGDAHAALIGYEGTVPQKLVVPDEYNDLPVWSIEDGVFADCAALEEVELPRDLFVGSRAFQNCTSLKTIRFNMFVRVLGESAFEGCTSLVSVDTGSTGHISARAFYGCSSLTEFATAAQYIEADAFGKCGNLQTVKITGYRYLHTAEDWDETGNEAFMQADQEWIHYDGNMETERSETTAKLEEALELTVGYAVSETDVCHWYHTGEDYSVVIQSGENESTCTCFPVEAGEHTVCAEVVDEAGNVVSAQIFRIQVD